MFSREESQKGSFLEQTKAAREERANEKKRKDLVITLQAHIRGWQFRKSLCATALEKFDSAIPIFVEDTIDLKPSIEIFEAAKGFLFVWERERDQERFERLCRYILLSLESPSKTLSYAGIVLMKEYALQWISHVKKLLKICCSILETLRPELPADTKLILVYLHTLIAFTGTKTWQFLSTNKLDVVKTGMNKICSNIVDYLVTEGLYPTLKILLLKGLGRSKIALKNVSLTAIVALSILPLVNSDFPDKLMTVFLIEILSTPGLILHLDQLAQECLSRFEKHKILHKVINLLYNEQNIKIVFNALEGSYALCLLANIVNLCYIERETTLQELYYPQLTFVLIWLLESCQHYVVTKQSNLTHWHPILGWFAQKVDSYLQEALPHVKSQLFLLWSHPFVKLMLGTPLMGILQDSEANETVAPPSTPRVATNILKRVVEHRGRTSNSSKSVIKLGSKECTKIALLCGVYQTTLKTLTQLKLDILTGLCYQDQILYNLWQFFGLLGPNYGLKSLLELIVLGPNCTAFETPEFLMLQLFCDCMTHYVTILDDLEMFNQQKPFRLTDFVAMSNFLNNFLYKALLQNLFDARSLNLNPLFQSMHTLLLVLYRRDCRRNYTPENHWLIKEIKVCSFMSDLEKGKKNTQALLQKMPHIIPHYERVQLFRKYVANEKAVFGLTESACASPHSTLITVHRKRIVEDGYRQLALLPPQSLKGVIRVRFVNEQGLDEAGIDQDGVFKVELGVSPLTPQPTSPPASFSESPEETDDFVLVPANLPFEERNTGSAASPPRPSFLPIDATEPIPVPSPTKNVVPRSQPISMKRRSSQNSSFGCQGVSIGSLSPPAVQFVLGTPPGGRRRSASGSSCDTPPPVTTWSVSPSGPSSLRRSGNSSPVLVGPLAVFGSPPREGMRQSTPRAMTLPDFSNGVGLRNLLSRDSSNMPLTFIAPELPEETLLQREHNETLAKLNFVLALSQCVVEVAKQRASPLENVQGNSEASRRAEQLVLLVRALQLLSSGLGLASEQLQNGQLQPSASVKTVVSVMHNKFRQCLTECKALDAPGLLNRTDLDTSITADKILYTHAIQMCQSAALDELFGNPEDCFQRYQSAQILLHSLSQQVSHHQDKALLTKYKDAVEKRLFVLQQQGYIYSK